MRPKTPIILEMAKYREVELFSFNVADFKAVEISDKLKAPFYVCATPARISEVAIPGPLKIGRYYLILL